MNLFKATIKQKLSASVRQRVFLSALGGRYLKGSGVFLILILFTTLSLSSQTIEVKQDSTGDYTQIQEAIDHAWPGDTVLVWPGTYYENIIINSKGIILGSLMMITGDEAYKYNTIIDGGQNGSCIVIEYIDTFIEINGFTLTNGKGKQGGGIYVINSNIAIKNNIVSGNMANKYGGGINISYNNNAQLKGNIIKNNQAHLSGGGIIVSVESYCIFDSINRNSIYLNFAERGCDFIKATDSEVSTIYLDTCTVLNPDTYFVISLNNEGYPINDLTVDVQNGVLQPYDGDIYVNPETGSNENSGSSWGEALKSIAWAYHKIHVDSTNKNTIFLADGVYSDTTNNEKFPLNIRPFINLVGSSREGTILDGNEKVKLLKGNNNITDFGIEKMTLRGGPIIDYDDYVSSRVQLARLYTGCDRFVLDSMVFRDSYAYDAVGVLTFYQADSSVVQNCLFKDNIGGYAIRIAASGNKTIFINNSIITNQQPDENVPINQGSKMGKAIGDGGTGRTIVQNSLFFNNPRMGVSRVFFGNSYFINCTFANNGWYDNYSFIGVADASLYLYNCIAWDLGTVPISISIGEWWRFYHSYLNIYNSLIEGGEQSITVADECWHSDSLWCHIHYDNTNIDADPNFLGLWDDPYMIADGSPCIDAGTLANLPDFIELPEFDLAGNPRIVGDSIDMGAYEWNSTIVGFNEIGPGNREKKPKLLKASPNPFDWGTYLSVEVEAENEVSSYARASVDKKVEVYDNYGNLVRNILSTTLHEKQAILWYGDDNNGNPLPAGIYHVVMFSGEREIESLKVVKK